MNRCPIAFAVALLMIAGAARARAAEADVLIAHSNQDAWVLHSNQDPGPLVALDGTLWTPLSAGEPAEPMRRLLLAGAWPPPEPASTLDPVVGAFLPDDPMLPQGSVRVPETPSHRVVPGPPVLGVLAVGLAAAGRRRRRAR